VARAYTLLRYPDKTTREILFVPLLDMKYGAKPLPTSPSTVRPRASVLLLIIALKVFHFTWWQLSYLSLGVALVWI
jgi:hypothetical protein